MLPSWVTQQNANETAGDNPDGLHVLEFRDGWMILSGDQVDMLGTVLGLEAASTAELAAAMEGGFMRKKLSENAQERSAAGQMVDPCAWNMLLKRRFDLSCGRLFGHGTGGGRLCCGAHRERHSSSAS